MASQNEALVQLSMIIHLKSPIINPFFSLLHTLRIKIKQLCIEFWSFSKAQQKIQNKKKITVILCCEFVRILFSKIWVCFHFFLQSML